MFAIIISCLSAFPFLLFLEVLIIFRVQFCPHYCLYCVCSWLTLWTIIKLVHDISRPCSQHKGESICTKGTEGWIRDKEEREGEGEGYRNEGGGTKRARKTVRSIFVLEGQRTASG